MNESFSIIPGDPGSSVVIHVPHSSRSIPKEVRAGIVLDDAALARELDAMTDAFTDVIAERAADEAGRRPWLFINRLSRLVVDPERFPDEREEMNAVGMGAVYTRTTTGAALRSASVDEISGLVDHYFHPYADAFAQLVDERLDAVGKVTIIDLHSYPLRALPYELHAEGPRPEVCLGSDAFHTDTFILSRAREAFERHTPTGDVGVDSPFTGCYVPLKHYRKTPDVQGLMIELRRDLYMDGSFALREDAVAPMIVALVEVIDEIDCLTDLFGKRNDLETLRLVFDSEPYGGLGYAIWEAVGVHPRFETQGPETRMWIEDTSIVLTFPLSLDNLVTMASRIAEVGAS